MPALTLLRNAHVFAPDDLGVLDLLVAGRQIVAMDRHLELGGNVPMDVIDLDGRPTVPGLIDQHVHMAGGGGEGGFHYRTPEISLSHVTAAGVTTAVGVLGTDGVTRSTRELLAKAFALDFEGITTYIYSGAYQVPTRTLTGMPRSDLVLVDKVVGVGEIAIADSRSSHPDEREIAELVSEAYVGGLLAGKAGVVHFHMGDEDDHLDLLIRVARRTGLPRSVFVPTHLNRNPGLLDASIEWGKRYGMCDVTSGIRPDEHDHVSVKPSKAIVKLLDGGVEPHVISMSSDSNGSSPIFDERGKLVAMGIGSIATLWQETVDLIREEHLPIPLAISFTTSNVARLLKLRHKGRLKPGCDADIVVCDDAFRIERVYAKGRLMVKDGKPVVFGTFEDSSRVPGSPGSRAESAHIGTPEARAAVGPSSDDEDDFPDRDERQARSRRRRYCC
ncbi:beta-aspartyl-peptidase [Alicyclobacillus vulcanalis]|uniref:Beta-aspartyl-dipeptidase (Metallo-type) n=1 Tax=Alicyclobacillus vulcanalis TaxID=252246 RepID=A0A1N7LZC1_9BACL|nr:beta-aspartyl-peptidase [Alicyclobacillus vulcanalis]SIS79168.1 beta-aspartyl-dipeptidase (metallo-type) [Alicyclobacillus vulcanalis]